MSLFADGEVFDIVNRNLVSNSKRCEMFVPGTAKIGFGNFLQIDPAKTYSIYLSDSEVNKGIHTSGTTYLSIKNNTFYTETLWFTTDIAVNPDFSNNLIFTATDGYTERMQNVKTIKLGNNQYKVSGNFNSKNKDTLDLAYITNFGTQCLKTTAPIKVRFDALKVEKGIDSTDWCPAYDDVVDLQSQIDQLKSKLGG